MRVHRSVHARAFAVLPNGLLQDRRLSYTARGLLADLLSRPDGWREDGRQMADSSTQGRGAIRRALKELTQAGYYRVDRIRMPNGTVHSQAHVFDTPQPSVTRPGAGDGMTGTPDAPFIKNPEKEPTPRAERGRGRSAAKEPPAEPDEQSRSAVATLFRVIRPEPRLQLGEAEALELAPLVTRWLERGSTATELARALLPGLPATMHSPAAVIRYRLERRMPPVQVPDVPPTARYAECGRCHDPVPRPGICRPCAGLGTRPVAAVGGGAAAARDGAARARDAMRAARTAMPRCLGHDPAAAAR
ncbi:hypothetical protein [Kitasatospora sp. P5_F3]